MANIPSQEKRILRAERERIENRRYTSAIKTYFRRLQAAVDEGDDDTANAEHRRLTALIDKAVKRGALHRNTGARKKSRAARLRTSGGDAAATPAKGTKASGTKSGGAKASGKGKTAAKDE
jgi:small subunit ribosomal protein S20